MTITWNYAAGAESVKGFADGLEKNGGKVTKELNLPFPNVEFQALLTEIAAQKPDAVYAFFAGGGAVKFVKDYAAAGLNKTIPLYGPGFLTDGTLEAQGASAQGMLTTLHYADDLNTPKALSVVWEVVRSSDLTAEDRWSLLADFDRVLGFGLADARDPDAARAADGDERIEALLAERTAARANKDFATADRIRDELAAEGIEIVDTPDGPVARRAT